MSVTRFEPYRDPFREFDRLFSMAASGTRAPLSMPMDVYRGEDGSYHVEADQSGVIINLANVVAVRVSQTDSAATGQYL